jgi:hypothetical protein
VQSRRIESEESAGKKLFRDEDFFVELDDFKEQYGDPDETVWEKCADGVVREGAYVYLGKKGHHKVERFQQKAMKDTIVEDDGTQ